MGRGGGTTIGAQDGPARRWVLGARLVDGTGEVLTVGGATVKNSVGYGVTHALWGSQGWLGAMVELTLRVRDRRDGDEAPGSVLERGVLDAAAALVRCEDLAPGTAEQAVAGMAGAVKAVSSLDGLRAVGSYLDRNVAERDVAVLRGLGIGAWVDEEGERGEGREVRDGGRRSELRGVSGERRRRVRDGVGEEGVQGGAVVRGALDPDGVFV